MLSYTYYYLLSVAFLLRRATAQLISVSNIALYDHHNDCYQPTNKTVCNRNTHCFSMHG